MTYTFDIETKLPTLNEYILAERTNKFIAAKIKKQATTICALSCMFLKGKVDKSMRYYVYFVWHMPNYRLDPDNVAYAKKFVLDGLVKAGVLENDGAKNISGFSDKFEYDGKQFVTVTLISET